MKNPRCDQLTGVQALDIDEFAERVVSEVSNLCRAEIGKEGVLDAVYNAQLSSLNNLKFCAKAVFNGVECKLCINYEVAFIGLSEVEVIHMRQTIILPSNAPLSDEVELLIRESTEILSTEEGVELDLSRGSLNYLVSKGIKCRELEYELSIGRVDEGNE